LPEIQASVKNFYSWATINSLKNKERYEIFLNEEVPQIIKEVKGKEYNPFTEQPMQQMAPGTVQTINTVKPKEVKSMPNNKTSRTVIANTLKAARELENDGYYMEADLSTFIALELTKMTR
jgi:DNA primase large subunit